MSHVLAITSILVLVFGFLECNAQECKANGDKKWSYDNDLSNGPDHWEDDNPDCKGDQQSPIDIQTDDVKPIEDSEGLQFKDYDQPLSKVNIENLGYNIKVEPNDDVERAVIFGGVPYNLKAFYFHWGNKSTSDDKEPTSTPGSDHKIDGKQYAMEVQMVHVNENKDKIILAVLFVESDESNPTIEAIQSPIAKYRFQGDKYEGNIDDDYNTTINFSSLVPNGSSYYQYNGSQPLPPCTENVTWLILQDPSSVATTQLLNFEDLYSVKESEASGENATCHIVKNYRETQPLNDRIVYSG